MTDLLPSSFLLAAFVGVSVPDHGTETSSPAGSKARSIVEHVNLSGDLDGPLLLRRHHPDGSSSQAWVPPAVLLPSKPPLSSISSARAPFSASPPGLLTKTDWKGKGRYTIIAPGASVLEGTKILSSPCFAAVIASKVLDKWCTVCLRRLPAKARRLGCKSCNMVYYCSEACLDRDGSLHDLICLFLGRVRAHARRLAANQRLPKQPETSPQPRQSSPQFSFFDTDTLRLAVQVIGSLDPSYHFLRSRKHTSGSSPRDHSRELTEPMSKIMDLSVQEGAEYSAIWKEALELARGLGAPMTEAEREACGGVGRRGENYFEGNAEFFAGLLVRLRVNCHPFRAYKPRNSKLQGSDDRHHEGGGIPALGLFLSLASTVNHSCRPVASFNALIRPQPAESRDSQGESGQRWWYQDVVAELRAVRAMTAGEEVTYSYLEHLHFSRKERQDFLWQAFRFHCQCPRCEEEGGKEGGSEGGTQGWACLTCGGRVEAIREDKGRQRTRGQEGSKQSCGEVARVEGNDWIQCRNQPRACPTRTPESLYLRVEGQGSKLLDRGIRATTISLSSSLSRLFPGQKGNLRGGTGKDDQQKAMRALVRWLAGSGKTVGCKEGKKEEVEGSARFWNDTHPQRHMAAMLLVRMAQTGGRTEENKSTATKEGQPRPWTTVEEDVALAVGTGVLNMYMAAHGLERQPHGATLSMLKVKAMWRLVQRLERGGEAVSRAQVWRLAMRHAATREGEKSLDLFRIVHGSDHPLTLEAVRALKSLDAGAFRDICDMPA